MRRVIITTIAVIALGVSSFVYYLNPDRVAVKNYSAFETYQFAQRAGVSFCPNPDQVYTASIRRVSSGNYTFTATVLRPDPANDKECSTGIATHAGCMVEQNQPKRPLTDSEIQRVKAAFASLSVYPNPLWECRAIGIDPCRIAQHTWGDNAHNDYVCSADRLPDKQSTSIINLLSALGDAK